MYGTLVTDTEDSPAGGEWSYLEELDSTSGDHRVATRHVWYEVTDTEDSAAGGEWLHLRRTMVYGELPSAAAYSLQ